MNGAGVVSTPPKPAPRPLAKPPLPRRSTSDAIPVPSPKPATSPKPPPPAVAQKPKPGQAPLVSPKPPPPTRPRSISAGSLPSPGAVPPETNGGTPPPVALKPKPKPKPPVKRKSFITTPQPSIDSEENAETAESLPKERSAPASEEVVSKVLGTLSEGSEQREGQTSLENKDNSSLQAEENRENSGDVSKNETSQSAGDVVRNSDAANLLNHAPDKEQEHCETSRNDSIDNTAATPSKLPIAVKEEGKDSCKILLPHDKRNDKNDSAPTEADLETSNTSITKAFEASATESSGVSSNIVPCSESTETPQVTAKPTPTSVSEPEGGSGATDPALSDNDDDDDKDDAFKEIQDSTRKEESVEHRKPPVPAPRPSLSSVTSEVSSLDSYDFLNTSRGGNSFKSQRSSQSIRSQGSSCLGSDSEDESGVFEVQPDIPEEDEELEKIKLPAENTNSCEKDSLKGQSSRISVFADLQEKEGHIAEGDIVLVSVTSGCQRNSKGEEDTKSKESGQVVPEQEHSGIQKSTGEQSVSSSSVVVGHVDDHTGIQGCIDAPENTEDDPSLAQVDISESGDVNLSKSEKSELHLPEVCDNIQKSEGPKREVEEEVSEEGKEETEDSEEEEEQFDEMGKRIFSLSRKKKPGVLKYSSGEFHEQYEASGKEKDISESSKSKDPKKKPKKEPKKGKKDAADEKIVIEDVPKELAAVGQEEQGATSEEERPSKPPRTRPQATPEELEVGRASTTSDVSTSPLVGEGTPRPVPVRRVSTSLSTSSSRPNISLKHRVSGIGSDSDEDDDDDDSSQDGDKEAISGATVDISKEEHTIISGGAGAVVTRVDSDGEEEVFIGGIPSSSMCTQTAFTDQASAKESAEVSTPQQKNNDQQFHHFATIEPVGDAAQRKESPSVEASAAPTDTLTTLSENQSVTISVTGSEPLSDSGELLSQQSEHALNKPWSEVAAVTVAVTTMPGPLVPEYTLVEGDSSATSSTSSLVPCQPSTQESKSHDSSLDDGDDDDDEDDDDERSMYDKIDIHDESYKSKDWKYRETAEEIGMMTQPHPENADEVAEATDTVSQLSESSTTASEKEFKSIFGERPHRIQRRRGSEDFVRLSRISRERTISFHRQDGTYGLRIQKSKPVVVTSLDPGGPAENAGLKVGDMILRVNGQDVRQLRHSEVVKLATEAPEPLVLVVGTVVCNSLNLRGDHTIMCGYMHKLASVGMIKQWRKRWFALKHDNCLYYYKTEHDILPQGAIVLQNYTVTKARDAGKQFSFKLTKEGARTYYFSTANEEERSSWGKAINDAANPNHKSDVWLDISTHNVSLPALSIKDPECTGFLTKWNSKMKNARRRYCVLKDACLYYYKEMDALDAQGVVHLHGYSIQETELKGKKFSFTLKPPDVELREFYFFADHDTDRKRWVSALASSIGRWIQTNNPDDGDDDGSEMYI